jgi:hypothetical protein
MEQQRFLMVRIKLPLHQLDQFHLHPDLAREPVEVAQEVAQAVLVGLLEAPGVPVAVVGVAVSQLSFQTLQQLQRRLNRL